MSKEQGLPFYLRHVPKKTAESKAFFNPPCTDPFVGRFCRGKRGVGIVTGYKLVNDERPGRGSFLRYVWYGISYITGRPWSSFEPKPLSMGDLQRITWAWGGSQTPESRKRATAPTTTPKQKERGTGETTAMLLDAIEKSKSGLVVVVVHHVAMIDYSMRIIRNHVTGGVWNSMLQEFHVGGGRIRFVVNGPDLPNKTAGLSRHVPVLWDHAVAR